MFAALAFELFDQAATRGDDDGTVAVFDQVFAHFQRAAFDAAGFQRRQHLHDGQQRSAAVPLERADGRAVQTGFLGDFLLAQVAVQPAPASPVSRRARRKARRLAATPRRSPSNLTPRTSGTWRSD